MLSGGKIVSILLVASLGGGGGGGGDGYSQQFLKGEALPRGPTPFALTP